MLQTIWDSVQQIIRIALYIGSGMLVTWGIIDQAMAAQLAAAFLVLLNGLWTFYWNRKAVTVAGLAAAGATDAAEVVEQAARIVARKKG